MLVSLKVRLVALLMSNHLLVQRLVLVFFVVSASETASFDVYRLVHKQKLKTFQIFIAQDSGLWVGV